MHTGVNILPAPTLTFNMPATKQLSSKQPTSHHEAFYHELMIIHSVLVERTKNQEPVRQDIVEKIPGDTDQIQRGCKLPTL